MYWFLSRWENIWDFFFLAKEIFDTRLSQVDTAVNLLHHSSSTKGNSSLNKKRTFSTIHFEYVIKVSERILAEVEV